MTIRVDLSEKVALVTGAGRGIGRAISLSLARDGADIVVNDVDINAAESVAEEIRFLGRRAMAIKADVSNKDDAKTMVEQAIKEFRQIDMLVNNAGIPGPVAPLTEVDEEEWDHVMDVNLKGIFLCCKFVIPHMIRRGGKIVNIASIAGKEGNRDQAPYTASKHGVVGLTKALAKEVSQYRIRVNCVCPALIDTRLIRAIDSEVLEELKKKILLGRIGKPEEVAELVKFLVSDASSFITGQAFNITGGRADY